MLGGDIGTEAPGHDRAEKPHVRGKRDCARTGGAAGEADRSPAAGGRAKGGFARSPGDGAFVYRARTGQWGAANAVLDDPRERQTIPVGDQRSDPRFFAERRAEGGDAHAAARVYQLDGKSAFAIATPQDAGGGSAERAAELAEACQLARLADAPIAGFMDAKLAASVAAPDRATLMRIRAAQRDIADLADELSRLDWFRGDEDPRSAPPLAERRRRRFGQRQTPGGLFRGPGEDAWATPFLSQFLLRRTGGDVGAAAEPVSLASLRDLSNQLSSQPLCEPYLNAALALLEEGFALDPGLSQRRGAAEASKRRPFSSFSDPSPLISIAHQAVEVAGGRRRGAAKPGAASALPDAGALAPTDAVGRTIVAAACVTFLKAVFALSDKANADRPVCLIRSGRPAAAAEDGGPVTVSPPRGLTLEGELNKLLWNVATAHRLGGEAGHAACLDGALKGEAIALSALRKALGAAGGGRETSMLAPLLTPRPLPAALLTGSAISPSDIVSAVRIRGDGTLEAATPTPGRS